MRSVFFFGGFKIYKPLFAPVNPSLDLLLKSRDKIYFVNSIGTEICVSVICINICLGTGNHCNIIDEDHKERKTHNRALGTPAVV